MKAYLQLLRPQQWPKNLFVLIPLIFSRAFWDIDLVWLSFLAALVFTLTSASVYVLNDVMDYERDRLHPEKKGRPIASGKISPIVAAFLWVVLVSLSVWSAFSFSLAFLAVVVGYLFMNVAYSLLIKQYLFLDVIFIALGFVFRVLGGGVAIGVLVTDWMIVLVFLFVLFLSLGKRRQEIKRLEKTSVKTRKVLTQYTIELIDQLHAIVAPIVVTCYIVYTFSERQNNPFFIATIPLIIYCFFRYLYLLKNTGFGESSKDYLADWKLAVVGVLWFVLAMGGLVSS